MTEIEDLLVPSFCKRHIEAALGHYVQMVDRYRRREWEAATGRSGKFVEAVLKALWVYTGSTPLQGRAFKAGQIITDLQKSPTGSAHDSVRLVIPRACQFVYDIASNRGARHDPDEVNPNEMDANSATMNCSWILAEMIRLAQKGSLNMDQVQSIVESLTQRKFPAIEEVDGRIYFHYQNLSAPDVSILTIAHVYPRRISASEVSQTIIRHHFTRKNASMALGRIRNLYDDDGTGNLRALGPCLRKADSIMQSKKTQ
jgi:hypothetical protein